MACEASFLTLEGTGWQQQNIHTTLQVPIAFWQLAPDACMAAVSRSPTSAFLPVFRRWRDRQSHRTLTTNSPAVPASVRLGGETQPVVTRKQIQV